MGKGEEGTPSTQFLRDTFGELGGNLYLNKQIPSFCLSLSNFDNWTTTASVASLSLGVRATW
jgi:hypothetical protein